MHTQWILALHEGISLTRQADGTAALLGPGSQLVLRGFEPALLAAVKRLVFPGERLAALLEGLARDANVESRARFLYYLHTFARRGFLQIAVSWLACSLFSPT